MFSCFCANGFYFYVYRCSWHARFVQVQWMNLLCWFFFLDCCNSSEHVLVVYKLQGHSHCMNVQGINSDAVKDLGWEARFVESAEQG